MQFTGRLTKDALVNHLKDDRNVVSFTVALNDYYKPKDATEGKQYTTFVECAYWISTKIAERLKKGCLVEVAGRLYATAYTDMQGNPRATIHCHVQRIKIHSSNGSAQPKQQVVKETKKAEVVTDDLPF